MPTHSDSVSDDELQRRTQQLLVQAEAVSRELVNQTEQLARTLDVFTREVLSRGRHLSKDTDHDVEH